jgi:NAD(P)-dependent dehydrogenase (short-subunit alcohol dehydrogenase family)
MSFRNSFKQIFPGKPTFTEKDIPDQHGKVFMITGGNAGLGFELTKILYSKGAKIYILCRSQAKAEAAIKLIKDSVTSQGDITYIHLDCADLTTVKPAINTFLAQETKLDVLWNNAGIASAPIGSKTKQGHELILGTNTLAAYLLTKMLLPLIQDTAKLRPKNSVRIVWACSPIIELENSMGTPKGGISMPELSKPGENQPRNYAMSKVGNWFLASEYAKRFGKDGIVSLAQNSGNLKTAIWDTTPWMVQKMSMITMHPPIYGAYSSMWAGLSKEITVEDGGRYGVPWGKWHPAPRQDLLDALRNKSEGGTGQALEFWSWCEEQTKSFA